MLITEHNGQWTFFKPGHDECFIVWYDSHCRLAKLNGDRHRGYDEGSWLSLLVVTGLTENRIEKLWNVVPFGARGWILDDRLKKDAGI
jgi:hypothetical protein